jgi:Chaperone of endosialidase
MRKKDSLWLALFAALALAGLQSTAVGQNQLVESKAVGLRAEGMAVRFDSAISYSSATLTVSGPDGIVSRKEFTAGSPIAFSMLDKAGSALGDGQYTYELRFTMSQLRDFKERAVAAPDDGSEDEQGRVTRRRLPVQGVVQSGTFSVLNGAIYAGGETEPTSGRQANTGDKDVLKRAPAAPSGNTMNRLRNHRLSLAAPMPDDVIADDLIVQGSACIGLDCVNNESFGFDTIRLKENNTRIKFDDTSTSAGFPNHDWQLTANDSASGGANKFSIEDISAATVPFTITGSAPSNAIFVDSTGRVGLRTSTPALDLQVTTGNTPAHRFEQNGSSGFVAQTWDVAGNEANFFVRDVTGGSRLPFRIRPGAPTSSIDISATGAVGIGTASPQKPLHVISPTSFNGVAVGKNDNLNLLTMGYDNTNNIGAITSFAGGSGSTLSLNQLGGRVGVGTTAPDQTFSVNGDASKNGGGSWQSFSDERLKIIKGSFNSGLNAVMRLQPLRYEYKKDNALGLKSEGEHVGFGAQAVQKIIPEAVTKNVNGYLMVNNDPILWTMLNAIKEQQKEIAELKGQIKKLQTSSHQRRR